MRGLRGTSCQAGREPRLSTLSENKPPSSHTLSGSRSRQHARRGAALTVTGIGLVAVLQDGSVQLLAGTAHTFTLPRATGCPDAHRQARGPPPCWRKLQTSQDRERPRQRAPWPGGRRHPAPHLGLPFAPALRSVFFVVLIVKVIEEVLGLQDALSRTGKSSYSEPMTPTSLRTVPKCSLPPLPSVLPTCVFLLCLSSCSSLKRPACQLQVAKSSTRISKVFLNTQNNQGLRIGTAEHVIGLFPTASLPRSKSELQGHGDGSKDCLRAARGGPGAICDTTGCGPQT